MDRRVFLAGTGAMLLATPLAAEAQQGSKVRTIGVVGTRSPVLIDAWKEGLRRLGWVEGQNFVVERLLLGDRSPARMQEFARDLVRLKIEVMIASNNIWISAAKAATATIPIVMVEADDPIGQGYVASLARPGGNITGLAGSVTPETAGKRVEFLAECRPGLSRVACLVDPTLPGYQTYSLAVESAARSRGMVTRVVEVREPDELAGAFAMIVNDHMQALVVLGSNFLFNERSRIAALAVSHHLPTAFPWREGPEEGALLSYGRNIRALWRRAAVYVDKILKGANPADLPIEQPTTFELVINLKTAKALGLTIPPSVLGRADEIIQ